MTPDPTEVSAAIPWKPPADLDSECLALCVALNKLPGIRTTESCCGHQQNPYRIFFQAKGIEHLAPLCYYFDVCHSGCRGWRVEVYTDCSMCPARFVVEGPIGGFADSEVIAKCIEDYLREEIQAEVVEMEK